MISVYIWTTVVLAAGIMVYQLVKQAVKLVKSGTKEGKGAVRNIKYTQKIKSKDLDLSQTDEKGRSWLMNAQTAEHTKILLEKGADVNAKDNDGKTALMYAIERQDLESARMLIEAGADINAQNKNGNTVLMYTTRLNDISSMKALIERGVDINAQNKDGNTALMFARSMRACELLVANKSDIDMQNNQGQTALMLRAAAGNENCIAFLVNKGADITLADNNGQNALQIYKNTAGKGVESAYGYLRKNILDKLTVPQDKQTADEYEDTKKTLSLQGKKGQYQKNTIDKKASQKQSQHKKTNSGQER